MSETEQDVPFEEPGPDVPETEAPPTEAPEGVDPETGEVLEDEDPGEDDAEASAAAEREAEIAAERQAAEQEQAASEAEIERQQKALDRATKAYTDKLKAALGDDLSGFVPCPLCADAWPGIRLPVMPAPEHVAAVKIAIGEDPDPTLNDDGYSRRCPGCDGWGKVSTGSRVTGQKAATCYDCGGHGWLSVGTERDSQAQPVANGSPVPAIPQPLEGDAPRTPEEERLRQLGAIVVWPPAPPDLANLPGV